MNLPSLAQLLDNYGRNWDPREVDRLNDFLSEIMADIDRTELTPADEPMILGYFERMLHGTHYEQIINVDHLCDVLYDRYDASNNDWEDNRDESDEPTDWTQGF